MSQNIATLSPQIVWKNFFAITQVPRPSGHEEKIVAFLKEFAKKHHLSCETDDAGNLLIKKPATSGMEDRKTVVFQCHMDMVPQKNKDSNHDFVNDPLEIYIDGEWVTAKGTTLGADNGMGISAMLAVLESNDLAHGAIEALFTSDEEVGMTGAKGLSSHFLLGDVLLNLDTEEEGEVYMGCSGGSNTDVVFNYHKKSAREDEIAYQINIAGLLGGHSGADIHLKRGNAIKILVWILRNLSDSVSFCLASINGGGIQHNAIPREAHAVITVAKDHQLKTEKALMTLIEEIKKLFKNSDAGLTIDFKQADMPTQLIDAKTEKELLKSVAAAPDGMIKMSKSIPDLVETSTNTAYIKTENEKIIIYTSQRSSVESEMDKILQEMKEVFENAGATVKQYARYPGWEPNINSPILAIAQKVYQKNFHKELSVKAIHAGLECGLISSKYPTMDMISLGPTIRRAHSPDEKVEIASVEKFWKFFVALLKEIPKK